MSLFVKIFRNVIFAVTIIILVLCAAIIGPNVFGFKPFIATSGSMEPAVPTGSLVYVNINDKDVAKNDIIMYKIPSISGKSDKMVTHRVVDIQGDEIITKGDANEDIDLNPIRKEQVIGTYAYHIPQLGFMYDRFGYKSLVVLAVWILILNGLAYLLSYLLIDRAEKEELSTEKLENGTEEDAEGLLVETDDASVLMSAEYPTPQIDASKKMPNEMTEKKNEKDTA